MRGTEYLENKKDGFKGNQYSEVTAKPAESTSQTVAKNYNVSPRTIARDSEFANEIHTLIL